MDAQWHGMLRRARSLVGTTVQVAAKPSNPEFRFPVYEGPNIKHKVGVSLEPGTDFQCVEVVSLRTSGASVAGLKDSVGSISPTEGVWLTMSVRFGTSCLAGDSSSCSAYHQKDAKEVVAAKATHTAKDAKVGSSECCVLCLTLILCTTCVA